MSGNPIRLFGPGLLALGRDLVDASVPQVMRIVALVDSMVRRGPADQLIDPLRERLARLRPPRPLRFDRLLFYPLDLLIVPPASWRSGQDAIPRSALLPMTEHVRLAMGAAGAAIVADIDGRTTDDGVLISHLGGTLWPAGARILATAAVSDVWTIKGLGEATHRPLVGMVATLLAEAGGLDRLRAEAATGLLPVGRRRIEAILSRVVRTNSPALPMMLALLLDSLPDADELLAAAHQGIAAAAVDSAFGAAVDLLLQQLDRDEGIERRIAGGTLAEAGAATRRMTTLLAQLDGPDAEPPRRERLRTVRQRLGAGCRARFASGLRDELLAVLAGNDVDCVDALETAARGLRVLEAAGRAVSGGSEYDRLLSEAAQTIAAHDTLARGERLRLVEILGGSDAALALVDAAA